MKIPTSWNMLLRQDRSTRQIQQDWTRLMLNQNFRWSLLIGKSHFFFKLEGLLSELQWQFLLSIWLQFSSCSESTRYMMVYVYETSLYKILKPTVAEDNYDDRVNGLNNYNTFWTWMRGFQIGCSWIISDETESRRSNKSSGPKAAKQRRRPGTCLLSEIVG